MRNESKRTQGRPQTIALCNQKGGVGKTTTAFHLARAAVLAGHRVLAVDADPQGNLTSTAAADPPADDQAGLADVLSDQTDDELADVIVAGVWDGLEVVPTSGDTLALVQQQLVIAGPGRESRLRHALHAVQQNYDMIVIDCAPSLDQLTANALTAADSAVIVTHSKQHSLDGLGRLLVNIDVIREHCNSSLRVAGIIINQHENQTISAQRWANELRGFATARELPILEPVIPKRVLIADAAEASYGLDQWGGQEARELARIYDQQLAAIRGEPA